MCVLRACHLALDNKLVFISLGNATSPAPSSFQLPVLLGVGLRLMDSSLSGLVCSLMSDLFGFHLCSHVGEPF